ncbi:hypothetical protein RA210_U50206 [Rubrivivax sp. A210]|uniref:hypothetical protein n=1 Tax=Rubrivivax sp. A210 TaxID=2772301 RepID=UPI00191B6C88|nr:hypothetical protein [Rubrivivax sp. A210]CAD5374255.1 hypothetical protein RA210_U50206 [Rubrivivax sp. A210]
MGPRQRTPALPALPPADENESVYLRIADDCLLGRLPERCTENGLLLAGQSEAAANFLRRHLHDAAREKAGEVPARAAPPPGFRPAAGP